MQIQSSELKQQHVGRKAGKHLRKTVTYKQFNLRDGQKAKIFWGIKSLQKLRKMIIFAHLRTSRKERVCLTKNCLVGQGSFIYSLLNFNFVLSRYFSVLLKRKKKKVPLYYLCVLITVKFRSENSFYWFQC